MSKLFGFLLLVLLGASQCEDYTAEASDWVEAEETPSQNDPKKPIDLNETPAPIDTGKNEWPAPLKVSVSEFLEATGDVSFYGSKLKEYSEKHSASRLNRPPTNKSSTVLVEQYHPTLLMCPCSRPKYQIVQWFGPEGSPLTRGNGFKMGTDFILYDGGDLTMEDSGEYWCAIDGKTCPHPVSVKVYRMIDVRVVRARVGANTSVDCGNMTMDTLFRWRHNGRVLLSNNPHESQSNTTDIRLWMEREPECRFHVDNVSASDEGIYEVRRAGHRSLYQLLVVPTAHETVFLGHSKLTIPCPSPISLKQTHRIDWYRNGVQIYSLRRVGHYPFHYAQTTDASTKWILRAGDFENHDFSIYSPRPDPSDKNGKYECNVTHSEDQYVPSGLLTEPLSNNIWVDVRYVNEGETITIECPSSYRSPEAPTTTTPTTTTPITTTTTPTTTSTTVTTTTRAPSTTNNNHTVFNRIRRSAKESEDPRQWGLQMEVSDITDYTMYPNGTTVLTVSSVLINHTLVCYNKSSERRTQAIFAVVVLRTRGWYHTRAYVAPVKPWDSTNTDLLWIRNNKTCVQYTGMQMLPCNDRAHIFLSGQQNSDCLTRRRDRPSHCYEELRQWNVMSMNTNYRSKVVAYGATLMLNSPDSSHVGWYQAFAVPFNFSGVNLTETNVHTVYVNAWEEEEAGGTDYYDDYSNFGDFAMTGSYDPSHPDHASRRGPIMDVSKIGDAKSTDEPYRQIVYETEVLEEASLRHIVSVLCVTLVVSVLLNLFYYHKRLFGCSCSSFSAFHHVRLSEPSVPETEWEEMTTMTTSSV